MPNFKNGPVESPEYGEQANQFSQVTEFTNDVYVYGKLYADIDPNDVFTEDTISFKNVNIEQIFVSGGGSYGGQNIFECLTAKNKFIPKLPNIIEGNKIVYKFIYYDHNFWGLLKLFKYFKTNMFSKYRRNMVGYEILFK